MSRMSVKGVQNGKNVNGEWREQMGNRKHYAQRLSIGSECGVQNGEREKSGDRSQETEWEQKELKHFA